jgi:hypothetical protein
MKYLCGVILLTGKDRLILFSSYLMCLCVQRGGSQNHLFVRTQNDFFGIKSNFISTYNINFSMWGMRMLFDAPPPPSHDHNKSQITNQNKVLMLTKSQNLLTKKHNAVLFPELNRTIYFLYRLP